MKGTNIGLIPYVEDISLPAWGARSINQASSILHMSRHRPTVVHLVVAANIGGAEHFVSNLASRADLTNADHVVALMTANGELKELLNEARVRIYDRGFTVEPTFAHFKRVFGDSDLQWLARILWDEGARLIHAHTYGSHILGARAARLINIPLMRTEHGVGHYRDKTRAMYRHWSLTHTDSIVAVSEYVAKFVRALEPRVASKTKVIWNGVDTERFANSPQPVDEPLTLAWTARLDPVKQAEIAIEAVGRVPRARLKLAGAGTDRAKLENMVAALGLANRVSFLGYQPDIREVVAGSHAVINCTREEGLPIALIEAAAMGRAAIAFNGGGVPELVEAQKTGWLANECTVEAFAALIADADNNRQKLSEFGANARARAESHFSLDSMCRQYGAAYSELVESHAANRAPMS